MTDPQRTPEPERDRIADLSRPDRPAAPDPVPILSPSQQSYRRKAGIWAALLGLLAVGILLWVAL